MSEKRDKYEQLLAKVDWHAPHPPKGYQYGVGRGAKGFVTTAELTTNANTTAKMTRDENDFFAAMERLEEHRGKSKCKDNEAAANQAGGRQGSGMSNSDVRKVKLSLEDLATLEAVPSVTTAKPITAVAARSAGSGNASSEPLAAPSLSSLAPAPDPPAPLVVRSARTEEGEAAEEHVFAEERVLTAYDVLRGKASAVQAGLHNVLEMGSTEEQTTWITHARAYREMGMTRRAYQTLVDGCAVTGRKGKRIWEERLRYLAKDNYTGRRRLLEEATSACPTEEDLWVQLLSCVPPLERVPCLQRAVLACPSSEHLWLRLVHYVPSSHDQRALLQKALQYTPTLPLLWARLARLETYQTGKEVFRAAAARFPSLALIIEAAKYVEWHELAYCWACRSLATSPALQASGGDQTRVSEAGESNAGSTVPTGVMLEAVQRTDAEVRSLVRTAQRNYLDLGEARSRHAWLSLALSLLREKNVEDPNRTEAPSTDGESAAAASRVLAAAPSVYVCTAAHMFLCIADPNDKKSAANAIPATWLEDLVALLPADSTSQHSVQCALWYSWLQMQQYKQLESMGDYHGSTETVSGVSTSAAAGVARSAATMTPRNILPVFASVILSAPTSVLHGDLPVLLRCGREGSAGRDEGALFSATAREPTLTSAALQAPIGERRVAEEEEEEELGKPSAAPAIASTSSVPVKARATDVASELPLPPPLVVALASLLGITSHIATSVPDALGDALLALQSSNARLSAASGLLTDVSAQSQLSGALELLFVEVPLAVSDALYRRGCFGAALSFIDRILHTIISSAAGQAAGALRLFVARAKMMAAIGDTIAADACLVSAIEAAKGAAATAQLQQREEVVWVKLAVLRRSQGQAIDALLADALRRCPRSSRLWLIWLEEKRRAIQQRQDVLAPTSAAASAVDLLRQDESLASGVRELRMLSKKALSPDHCHTVAAVWVFVAARVEAELLQNVAAARALLTDALSACAADLQSTRLHLSARGVSAQELERQARAAARIGVAQVMLEAQYGTPGQALEMAQEVLQKLPKTREGTFVVAQDDGLGELLGLFIALEPPASRGRAAAQVMRQWKSREPLALCAVAQLYFAAGQYARALDQAKKAVQLSKGRCGDAAGLLWRMAEAPAMQPFMREAMAGKAREDFDRGGEEGKGGVVLADAVSVSVLTAEAIQQWVFSVMNSSGNAGVGKSIIIGASCALAANDNSAASPGGSLATPLVVVPNSGPLWITVAKAEDPSNVTLLGYRRPVTEMLRDVANRISLKRPESTSAAAHA